MTSRPLRLPPHPQSLAGLSTTALLLACTLLLCGCGTTGMSTDPYPFDRMRKLKPGDKTPVPLEVARPALNQSVTQRSTLRGPSKLAGRNLFFACTTVNGTEAELLIDSGAPVTAITGDLAHRADVPISKPVGNATFSEDRNLRSSPANLAWGRVDLFSIGPFQFRHRAVLVADQAYRYRLAGIPLVNAYGVLGLDILRSFAVTLDYASGEVTFSTSKPKDGAETRISKLTIDPPGPNARVWIIVNVNGTPARFMLDTGATEEALLNERDWQRLGLTPATKEVNIDVGREQYGPIRVRRVQGPSLLPYDLFSRHWTKVTLNLRTTELAGSGPRH